MDAPRLINNWQFQTFDPYEAARNGAALAAPIQDAVTRAGQTGAQFAISRGEFAQRQVLERQAHEYAMEQAKAQQAMQIQREQMRDNRMMEVQRLRNQSALDVARSRYGSQAISGALDTLINRYGGDAPEGDISDPGYLTKVHAAITARKQYAVNADAKAYASLTLQKRQNEQLMSQAYNSPEYKGLLDTAAKQTSDTAKLETEKWIMSNNQQVADLVANGSTIDDALRKANAVSQYADAYRGLHGSLQAQWLHQNGGLAGGAAEKLAVLKSNLSNIDTQFKNLSMMPGPRGPVPKVYWGDVISIGNDEAFQRTNFPSYFTEPNKQPVNPITSTLIQQAIEDQKQSSVSPANSQWANRNWDPALLGEVQAKAEAERQAGIQSRLNDLHRMQFEIERARKPMYVPMSGGVAYMPPQSLGVDQRQNIIDANSIGILKTQKELSDLGYTPPDQAAAAAGANAGLNFVNNWAGVKNIAPTVQNPINLPSGAIPMGVPPARAPQAVPQFLMPPNVSTVQGAEMNPQAGVYAPPTFLMPDNTQGYDNMMNTMQMQSLYGP